MSEPDSNPRMGSSGDAEYCQWYLSLSLTGQLLEDKRRLAEAQRESQRNWNILIAVLLAILALLVLASTLH